MGCKIEPLSEWDISAMREMCAKLLWNIIAVLGVMGWFWQGSGESTEKGKTLMGLGAVMFSRYTDDELQNFKWINNGNE